MPHLSNQDFAETQRNGFVTAGGGEIQFNKFGIMLMLLEIITTSL